MITKFFKNIGKGILNILVIPVWAVGLAIMSVFGILIFVFIAIKKVILFISGRSVSNELPEDIQARKIIQAPTVEEPKVEIVHAVIEDPVVEEPKKVEPIKQAIEDQKIDAFIEQQNIDDTPLEIENNAPSIEYTQIEAPETEIKEESVEFVEEKPEEITETYEPKAAKF